MLDIGWPELLVVAIVMIIVVGPKDLPKMLRTFGKTTAKLRSMAGDFRRQFDDALKEAELEELKSLADTARSMNPANEIRKNLNPLNKIGDEIKKDLTDATRARPAEPAKGGAKAESDSHPAEPAKTGASALPGGGESGMTPKDGAETGKGA
ncbi:MAG: twin-arginine translocase subunit TatB [Phyllobacteriaceae bacterium]|nr:twin-arginine translocase subunit TatB [Phyllobacteriaceae bacterium]MBA89659.1 twin-arginine translocase subunit TatB [Phyllobacteriaceae bacterium]